MRLVRAIAPVFMLLAAVHPASSARRDTMNLGNFSVSLTVKDINASKVFYEKLGFQQVLGDTTQGWAIMKNRSTNIGLFQGMFDRNILTFNPGWDQDANPIKDFDDIRTLRDHLKQTGLGGGAEIESEQGPASFTIQDPDGNPILIDQHV